MFWPNCIPESENKQTSGTYFKIKASNLNFPLLSPPVVQFISSMNNAGRWRTKYTCCWIVYKNAIVHVWVVQRNVKVYWYTLGRIQLLLSNRATAFERDEPAGFFVVFNQWASWNHGAKTQKRKSDGFLAYADKPESDVPDMKRRSDHHHPRTQPPHPTPFVHSSTFSFPSSVNSSSTVRGGTGGLFGPKKTTAYSNRPAKKYWTENSEKKKLPPYHQLLGFSVDA